MIPTDIFLSYPRRDAEWRDRLLEQLAVYEESMVVSTWTDEDLVVGDAWRTRLDEELEGARAVILLISAAFLQSRFINDHELPTIRRRHDDGLLVMPVITRPCNWQDHPWLSRLQALPGGSETLSGGTPHEVDLKLMAAAREIAQKLSAAQAAPRPTASAASVRPTLRLPGDGARTAQYVCYVARERVRTTFDQVDPSTLQEAMAIDAPFGGLRVGEHEMDQTERRTLGQLDAVVRFLEKTSSIADLNHLVGSAGRLDADWYYISSTVHVVGWSDEDPSVRVEGPIGDFTLRLSCAKRNFSGLNAEAGSFIPTSTNWFFFRGETGIRVHGLVRLAGLDRADRVLMGSPLYLVLDPLDVDLGGIDTDV